MLSIDLSRYIAAGCLVVDRSQAKVSQHLWPISNSTQWQHFGPSKSSNNIDAKKGFQIEDEPTNPLFLAPELQEQLLASSGCLGQYSDLLRKGWVYMTFSPSLDDCEQGVFRVYILPDDVDNRKIPRSDSSLRKVRMRLASLLDFSNSTWQGHTNNPLSPSPSILGTSKPAADSQDGEEQSLLQLFNNLPSPNPRPEDIEDPEVRETAYNLLGSAVTGLKTTLYAYQRRSAALMLQRESQPQQVVDPRLVKVVDQLGVPWYHDSVAGTCLRESRSYDGPCGGILAEEMGSGKTLICLALILASRHIPSATPEHLRNDEPVIRPRVGSLADMAAACATRNSVPWRSAFGCLEPDGIEYTRCIDAIRRNPGFYYLQPPARRRQSRQPSSDPTARKIYLSHCSLVIVPPNLVRQWKQEIAKHTTGLSVFTVDKNQELPSLQELVECDIVLFSSAAFERMWKNPEPGQHIAQVLGQVHFKRCIVDEGHRFGNSTTTRRINIQLLIEHLQISAKWIVTGTPSKGLFGVDDTANPLADSGRNSPRMRQTESSPDLEKDDLKRIGSIASLYLKMRPWANLPTELGDSPADWVVYVMQPKHSSRSSGRADCLKTTLESLIIRHRLSEIGELLPDVDEKIVYLDGSYQDRLVLNLFSMMIIFNAVQSERKDQDYFFHPRQRKALIELVSNLKQASFFGGAFFSAAQIRKAVETAEEFLRERKVPVSTEDEALLRDAIKLGHLAEKNNIKECASLFREVPLYVQKFPWRAGREWSLDFEDVDPVCTDSRMILALQKFLQPVVDAPTSLQRIYESGRFAQQGLEERTKGIDPEWVTESNSQRPQSQRLAGDADTGKGIDSSSKLRSVMSSQYETWIQQTSTAPGATGTEVAEPLAATQLVSTASAKLSYLIDQIVKYQDSEQMIVFYEHENVAYYLAGVLEILQIQHLIYAKSLTVKRRAQYVATFNSNPKFRVLLMDITQAAFGLDMKSASRIYFINPVLNPQVEAQAIGRARRISSTLSSSSQKDKNQKHRVTVETLVLRDSLEEVIVRRRGEMTQAEQWNCRRSILDDRPIYEWVLGARILPMPGQVSISAGQGQEGGEGEGEGLSGPEQMVRLAVPQVLFGRGFGRGVEHPDEDLVVLEGSPEGKMRARGKEGRGGLVVRTVLGEGTTEEVGRGERAMLDEMDWERTTSTSTSLARSADGVAGDWSPRPKKRVRVRFADDEVGE